MANARLARSDEKRGLRRISLCAPMSVLLRDLGVVRAIRRGERAIELDPQIAFDGPAIVATDLALRRVARAREGCPAVIPPGS